MLLTDDLRTAAEPIVSVGRAWRPSWEFGEDQLQQQ